MTDDISEITEEQWGRTVDGRVMRRLRRGDFRGGQDVALLRKFVGMTQEQFALALGVSVGTLRNWEQGHRSPAGPALALLRIAARHPRIIRESLKSGEAA